MLDRNGNSVLHLACKEGDATTLSNLLKHPKLTEIINLPNNDGKIVRINTEVKQYIVYFRHITTGSLVMQTDL